MPSFKGKTALITGASSGIGKEIATKLAAEGANLVLVARSQDRLEKIANSLTSNYGVKCTVIPSDLSKADCGISVLEILRSYGISVDILINNAGLGTYGHFDSIGSKLSKSRSPLISLPLSISLMHLCRECLCRVMA